MYAVDRGEAARSFMDDIREKRSAGRGARHKKCGSRTSYVSMPSDHITPAEWKRRNGKVNTYQLGVPMTWAQFRSMPADLREEYIKRLRETYHITKTELAEAFEVSFKTLNAALNDCQLSGLFPVGCKMKRADREAFRAFWHGEDPSEEEEDPPVAEPSEQSDLSMEDLPSGAPASFALRSFQFQFSGAFHMDQLTNTMRRLVPEGTEVTVTIQCTMKEAE